MATTRLMPLHAGKGRTIASALGRTKEYVENPDKTDDGEWISSYECNPEIADQEFLMSKRNYEHITGRKPKNSDVIAYHLRQSFKPGEITPEKANALGYELVMRLTKGNHAFIVCTHVDKAHIHNHIIFNSTGLDCKRKFRNFFHSSFAIRRISDMICLENGLSVIENPKPSRGSYADWLGKKPPTMRQQLEVQIDLALKDCKDYEEFILRLQRQGVQVKRGKYLSLKLPDGKSFIRCKSLNVNYTETAIADRLSGKLIVPDKSEKPNLLIDIQAKLRQANSPGFEHWATIFNLKEIAKTLVYLNEAGWDSIEKLAVACDEACDRFESIRAKITANETRMREIRELEKQIGTYRKTHDVYARYRKLSGKKKGRFYNEHTSEIIRCQAAKKYFDSLGLDKLPSIQDLKQEYAALSAENKQLWPRYREAKETMKERMTAKENVRRFLAAEPKAAHRKKSREEVSR